MPIPVESYNCKAYKGGMKLYRCKRFYFSGLVLSIAPRFSEDSEDYEPAQEMRQQGTGEKALEHAFVQCHAAGRDMQPGDVVELDDGSRYRCEVEGWTEIRAKQWTAWIQRGHGRQRG